jgi:hypothetical protein
MAEPKGFKSLKGQTLNDATSGMTQQQFEKTVSGLQKIGEPVNLRQVESIWNKRYKKQQPQSSTSKFIMKILNFGNTKKTGEIKKNYGGSMKKMKDGKKVGSTPVPKRFTKALDDKYKDKSKIYGMILSPSGKKSTRKRTTIEKIFGGGPNDLYNRQTNEAKKAGKKAAGYEMFKEYPELMKRAKKEITTKKSGGPIKKLRVGGKVGMTQHQTMACGRKK